MPILTSQLLDSYPYSHHADPQSIQRGRDYHKRGSVYDVYLVDSGRKAICSVSGNSGDYEVEIEVDK